MTSLHVRKNFISGKVLFLMAAVWSIWNKCLSYSMCMIMKESWTDDVHELTGSYGADYKLEQSCRAEFIEVYLDIWYLDEILFIFTCLIGLPCPGSFEYHGLSTIHQVTDFSVLDWDMIMYIWPPGFLEGNRLNDLLEMCSIENLPGWLVCFCGLFIVHPYSPYFFWVVKHFCSCWCWGVFS